MEIMEPIILPFNRIINHCGHTVMKTLILAPFQKVAGCLSPGSENVL